MSREVRLVQVAVPFLLVAAVAAGIFLPTPDELPSVAIGSEWILFVERTGLLFYGALLLLLPLVRALRGQLPIELTLRGARYEEATKASEEALLALDERFTELAELVGDIARRLAEIEGQVPGHGEGGLH